MKTYIIAEVGPNHNGSLDLAIEYIEKLSKAGADAVKFQLVTPEKLHSKDSILPNYIKFNTGSKKPLELSRKYQLSFEQHKVLYKKCNEYGINYICSAFDLVSIKFLNTNFDLPYFKIASGEIFSLDVIEYIAKQNRPILLSTGMATIGEIAISLDLLNENFKKDITLLHCVSLYPTPYKSVNLNVIKELKNKFSLAVGFSDHSLGIECAVAAVAIGAEVIEKHVTLDKNLSGLDHKNSITIEEFELLVKNIRNVELSLGNPKKIISNEEKVISKVARKSIVSKRKINIGEIITEKMICFKRPGTGFLPIEKEKVIGKRAKRLIKKDRVIKREDIK